MDKAMQEKIREIVLEIRQYLYNTEFAPEPFTEPIDPNKLTVEFPAQILEAFTELGYRLPPDRPDREKIAKTMYYQHVTSDFRWENERQWFRDEYLEYADQILALLPASPKEEDMPLLSPEGITNIMADNCKMGNYVPLGNVIACCEEVAKAQRHLDWESLNKQK